MKNYKNTRCINCGSSELKQFLDLGDQPNGNHFPDETSKDNELMFPFAMDVCTSCWQVQLEEFPSPEFMFRDHPYITGINEPVVDHFTKLSKHIVDGFGLEENSLVIDIGCNDGTFLNAFRQLGMRTLGVDPGSITGELCRERGINVCQTFWSSTAARAIKDLNLAPDLITATAVFYHVPDIHDFVSGLREVMTDKTIFMAQCVYLKDVINKNQFDHFYHEHTMIHSLSPLKRLFEEHGMRILDVEFDPIHGGSFLVYVGLSASSRPTTKRVADALASEAEACLTEMKTYLSFSERVRENRDQLVKLLTSLNQEGKMVFALCAPVKGSTLLNYAGIGPDLVQVATEVNPHKIGRLTPGTHIPVVSEAEIEKQPDFYLVLSWNFLDFFLEKYRTFLEAGGKFIVTNPSVRVLGIEDVPVKS